MDQVIPTPSDEIRARLIAAYDLYRKALLNRKYYGHRLASWKRWNTGFEIALAVGTSGTIGTWALWKTGAGQYAWTFVAAFAAVLGVIKPIIQLGKGIERYSKLYSGWGGVFYDLEGVVEDIKATHKYTGEMANIVTSAHNRIKDLTPEDDPNPNRRLVRKYYNEVLIEIPPAMLWVPQATSNYMSGVAPSIGLSLPGDVSHPLPGQAAPLSIDPPVPWPEPGSGGKSPTRG